MKNTVLAFLISLTIYPVAAQQIPSPEMFLGYELGSEFTLHFKVVDYYQKVAELSPRMKLLQYGETYEGRPLYVAFISTPANLERLDEIRMNNLRLAGLESGEGEADGPAIVWLSYNVHGNESSSTEASMKTLHYLTNPENSEAGDWLENVVVIMDPCINPDGRDRYVNYYKQYRQHPVSADPYAMSHREDWPGGRVNHYLFDLNRDWFWTSQQESQQRLALYNQWMPQIHVDFHEQSPNSPYYFAPGSEPYHQIITDWQRQFQKEIGANHAGYFDKENWVYFTSEVFDLLYPSYGDTYPMFNGAIGMTYEQAGGGGAGLAVKTEYGDTLFLSDRIAHHFTTGISTVEIASRESNRLLAEYRKYFATRPDNPVRAYIIPAAGQEDKTNRLLRLLDRHRIAYSQASESRRLNVFDYRSKGNRTYSSSNEDIVITTNQPKGRLVQALFEPSTFLADSITYDITAWNLPYAFGLTAYASSSDVSTQPYEKRVVAPFELPEKKSYGYVLPYESVDDGIYLGALLREGIGVGVLNEPAALNGTNFSRGSLVILRANNQFHDAFDETIERLARQYDRHPLPVYTGLATAGIDLGSENISRIRPVKAGLLAGPDTDPNDVGQVWHFFERELEYPITLLRKESVSDRVLKEFDVIVLADGSYGDVQDELFEFAEEGGRIVALGDASALFAESEKFNLMYTDREIKRDSLKLSNHSMRSREYTQRDIPGAIFSTRMDPTHPLVYGIGTTYETLTRGTTSYLLPNGSQVAVLEDTPVPLNGFAGNDALGKIGGKVIIGMERYGRGSVVYLPDNPLFRSMWDQGKLLLINAVFQMN